MRVFDALLDTTFRLPEDQGPSKVMPLAQAVRELVRPGMVLHHSREANAALLEVCRQFWGQRPGFTVAASAHSLYDIVAVHGGLVSKLITSNASHAYPAPAAIGAFQKAYREGRLEIETWSIYTLLLRFKAAALGLPFLPTRSMLGTDMARERRDDFLEMEDPFGSGVRVGLARPLQPDVSLVHAIAADAYGNAIPPSPYDDLWGPRAAREVILTADRIVPTSVIRRHASLVKLPGYMVSAVCPAPLGAHPIGAVNHGLGEGEGHREDFPFLGEFRTACDDPARMDAWIQEWVLDTGSHEGYLKKLGEPRIARLRALARPEAWREEIEEMAAHIPISPQANRFEMMVIAAGRHMARRARAGGYRVILSGVGTGALASWLAYYILQKEGYPLELLTGSGQFGFAPRPGLPVLTNISNVASAKWLSDCAEIYGLLVCGGRSRCLAALGAAQVDCHGNINSTRRGDTYLFGPGGGNDSASAAPETVLVVAHGRNRLVGRLDYLTSPGDRVGSLITTEGVMEKRDGELVLTGYFPRAGASLENRLKAIKGGCGWELQVAPDLQTVPLPTQEELFTVRLLDPKGFFIGISTKEEP